MLSLRDRLRAEIEVEFSDAECSERRLNSLLDDLEHAVTDWLHDGADLLRKG